MVQKKAVQKLIDLGCKRIGLLTTVDYVSVGKLRTEGYQKALQENNIEVDEDLILKVDDFDLSENEIQEFLKEKNMDGLFAVNEHFAIYAIKSFQENGLKVPEDVKVIGFTDGELSKRFIPSLTTVNQHGAEMGAQAARILIRKLENQDDEEHYQTVIVETGLVERTSTKI